MRQDYFFVPATTGEYVTSDIPFYVNCGGLTDTDAQFGTRLVNGRLDYTLYYLNKGELTISFGDRPFESVKAGAVIVIPPNVCTEYHHTVNEKVEIYWAHFTGGFVEKILEGNGLSSRGCIHTFPASNIAARSFQTFLDEMKNRPDESTRQRAAAMLILTVTTLSRLIDDKVKLHKLQRSFAYIQEHFTESISKHELAKMEGLGISQYYLLFQELMGITPSQYITKLRINLACKLLEDATLSVSEVARLCGYEDAFYFSRVFSKECKVSPSRYRKP